MISFLIVLGSYVDDAFGGAQTRAQAKLVIDTLILIGHLTATIVNPEKTRGPATSLVILGLLYCSVSRTCRLGEDKQAKYLARIAAMVASTSTTSKELEKLVGNLGFAAWVEPFGRPLLSCLYAAVVRDDPSAKVPITHLLRSALGVWFRIISRNRGLQYRFILNELPVVKTPIFVDASTSWGVGGVHGRDYFTVPHAVIRSHIRSCPGWESYPQVPIAWLELLAAYVAVRLFASRYTNRLMVLYTDNSNVVAWLGTRRSPRPVVCTLVSAIESIKYHHSLKLSVRFIPSDRNRTADFLSRNVVPRWLQSRGSPLTPDMAGIAYAADMNNILDLWTTVI